jgi:DNA-binding CsgD family transcriptional regulator
VAIAADRSSDESLDARSDELAHLIGSVDSTAASGGGAVVLRGEAGIGKSYLLARLIEDRRTRGWRVVLAQSDELRMAVPYSAFAHGVAALSRQAGAEVAAAAADAAVALDVSGGHPLASVHGAVARLFAALRDEAPTLLAIDDLQLVDDDTLVLVSALVAREGRNPLVLAGTLRRPDAAPRRALTVLLERTAHEEQITTVDLAPLDEEGLARLVSSVFGTPPHRAVVDVLARQSNGNPFLALQVLHALADAEADPAADPDGGFEAPAAVGDPQPAEVPPLSVDRRTAILHRVLRVDAGARRLARAVALVGSGSIDRLPLAADLAGLSADEAEQAFDALVEQGVLAPGDDDVYAFNHQLVRDALYQELGPAERWRWHQRAAERLGALPPSPALDLEIAVHVRETAEFGDERAITVLARAAELTCTQAPRSSIPWYRHALRVTPRDADLHAELAARLARALFLAGRPGEAAEVGRSTLPRLAAGPVRERLVGLVVEALSEISMVDEAVELIDGERSAGTPSLRLRAQAAYVHALAGHTEEADAQVGEVMAAIEDRSPAERVTTLVHLVHASSLGSGYRRLGELCDELERAAANAPVTSQLNAYAAISWVQAAWGETQRAAGAITRAQALLDQSRWTLYRAEIGVAQAINAADVGDWDTVLSIAEALDGELEEAGSLGYLAVLRAVQSSVLANRGAWAAARQVGEHPPPSHPAFVSSHVAALAEVDLMSGNIDAARTCLQDHLRSTSSIPPIVRSSLLGVLSDVESEAGNVDAASTAAAEAERRGPEQLDHNCFVRCRLAVGRATGDIDALRQALAVAERHKLALPVGRARLYLGTAGVDTEENLREAVHVFHALGATPWRRRAAAELRGRGLKVPRHRMPPSTLLTETETQIARLVQLGRPNREIASAVCLSVKTVQAYLSRIYVKTGCTTRLELARALDAGLLG